MAMLNKQMVTHSTKKRNITSNHGSTWFATRDTRRHAVRWAGMCQDSAKTCTCLSQKQHGTNKSDGLSFLSHFLWGCPRIFPSHSHKSLKIKDFPKHGSGFRTNSPQDPRFYRIHTRGAIVLVELTNTLADVEDIDVPPGRWQQPKKVGTNWTIGTIYIYWLVVYLSLWKIWVNVSWNGEIPNWMVCA